MGRPWEAEINQEPKLREFPSRLEVVIHRLKSIGVEMGKRLLS